MLRELRAEKVAIDAEQRQRNFAREQEIVGSASLPTSDQVALENVQERADLLRWQQDFEIDLEELVHKLRREQIIDGIWEKQRQLKGHRQIDGKTVAVYEPLPPLLNELGIHMIITQVSSVLNRNVINSNLTEDRILRLLKDTANTITDNIADNYDKYATDFLDFDHILRLVKNTMTPTLFRSIGGWTKKMDTTMNKRIEAFTETTADNQQRKGFMGTMIGR